MERRLFVMVQVSLWGDAVLGAALFFKLADRGAKALTVGQGRRPARLPQLLRRRAARAPRTRYQVGQLAGPVQIGRGPLASMTGQVGRMLGSPFQRTDTRFDSAIITGPTWR